MRQKRRRPGEEDGDRPDREPLVAKLAAILAKLHAPVQRAEKGEDDGAVRDLDVLHRVQRGDGRLHVNARERVGACVGGGVNGCGPGYLRASNPPDAASPASRARNTVPTLVPIYGIVPAKPKFMTGAGTVLTRVLVTAAWKTAREGKSASPSNRRNAGRGWTLLSDMGGEARFR